MQLLYYSYILLLLYFLWGEGGGINYHNFNWELFTEVEVGIKGGYLPNCEATSYLYNAFNEIWTQGEGDSYSIVQK